MCTLFDNDQSSEMRLARIAGSWLGGLNEHLIAAREFKPDITLAEAEAAWRQAERTVLNAGATLGTDNRGRPNRVILGSATAPFKVDLAGTAGRREPLLPAWYRISSAASHSTLWLVQQAATLEPDGKLSLRADPNILTAATCAVLGTFEDTVGTLGRYHGHTGTRDAVLTIQRRTVAAVELQRRWRKRMEEDLRAGT
ncbi:hypothetical protein POF50_011335 [Streptomyces sp. SL13]|uniref:Uncharacterized protein n=1 Tax=Streptantibioticus silvisoli TaxID=2705255 RepID=A0AA90H8K9_9ACTN|nr:hypothetical protein [Streptantibioticus silvisoli]MDI5969922.1 hypothetical protein [Streptantibioticus silvisoli]